jgi:hypothetical protein
MTSAHKLLLLAIDLEDVAADLKAEGQDSEWLLVMAAAVRERLRCMESPAAQSAPASA